MIDRHTKYGAPSLSIYYSYQARIQLFAKGEVVKIMENNVLLPQAANVSDRIPGTKTRSNHIERPTELTRTS